MDLCTEVQKNHSPESAPHDGESEIGAEID